MQVGSHGRVVGMEVQRRKYMVTMCGAWWVLEISAATLHKVGDCLPTLLSP